VTPTWIPQTSAWTPRRLAARRARRDRRDVADNVAAAAAAIAPRLEHGWTGWDTWIAPTWWVATLTRGADVMQWTVTRDGLTVEAVRHAA
jgi:hypothetical protein